MLSYFTRSFSSVVSACLILLCMPVYAFTEDTEQSQHISLEQAQDAQQSGRNEDAFALYQALADQGISAAQFALAFAYEQGLGVMPSQQLACEYYFKAATQSVPLALEKTGDCYLNNHLSADITTADNNERIRVAQSYYQQANQNGIFSAACKNAELTLMHQAKELHANAIAMCDQAVSKGSSQAALVIGFWYLKGKLVPLDFDQAEYYLLQAKPESTSEAAMGLAQLYDQLALLNPNDIGLLKYAIYWHEQLSSKGETNSYLSSSLLYWRLFNKTEDDTHLAKAYLWASAAHHVNDSLLPEAVKYINTVSETVPNHWKADLDTQVKQQITRFHTL
ncbi:MAG: hypothetical protein WA981_04935 [Glaciecola sp.]